MHLNEPKNQEEPILTMKFPSNFRTEGWVYVLSNQYMPDIYKIGMTTTHPSVRVKELSSVTGVPVPFKIEGIFFSDDPRRNERDIHIALESYRVNESREFFKHDLSEILETCRDFCLASANANVEEVANSYDIICFESLNKLTLPDLFRDIGIDVFGCNLAIAERLIRLGASKVISDVKKGYSLIFHDEKIIRIINEIDQEHNAYIEEIAEQQATTGIYGPRLPGGF